MGWVAKIVEFAVKNDFDSSVGILGLILSVVTISVFVIVVSLVVVKSVVDNVVNFVVVCSVDGIVV